MEEELNFVEHGDISGAISVTLANDQTLDDFCAAHIPEYNRDRFEALAIRLFLGKETVITVFATDQRRQEGSNFDPAKIPVKKFKLTNIPASELFSYCESLNFTMSTRNYPIEYMEVVNK